MTVVGVIAAGGRGERLGADRPKALVVVRGRALVDWSRAVLEAVCDRVIVAAPEEAVVSRHSSDWVVGGASRSASVRKAVAGAPEASVFVVHDAARPLVTEELVRRCIAALEPGVDGAVAAAPVTDTVKQADAHGRVLATLDRSGLWAVQTPQAFRADALRRALDVDEGALADATDDAGLVEAAGGSVILVEALRENLKVTTPLDLELTERLLGERAGAD